LSRRKDIEKPIKDKVLLLNRNLLPIMGYFRFGTTNAIAEKGEEAKAKEK
jgi:hypothetical protein